jgi:hypothetical protein
MSDQDEELFFKRFPLEKQDQVRQLVSFATLMGLTGKDLVSIGGKLDRIRLAIERDRLRGIVNEMDLRAIKSPRGSYTNSWHLVSGGTKYHFKGDMWGGIVTNTDTKAKHSWNYLSNWYYELGSFSKFNNSSIPKVMLNVWDGSITLP